MVCLVMSWLCFSFVVCCLLAHHSFLAQLSRRSFLVLLEAIVTIGCVLFWVTERGCEVRVFFFGFLGYQICMVDGRYQNNSNWRCCRSRICSQYSSGEADPKTIEID
ncbi:hypothetical protein BDV93DRAFT_357539 [Ceratobasidium sp. AG-I]|nr:hypothetical protein BDV93DRAFT_357539 [Ceratobasidium sp. AG-I]